MGNYLAFASFALLIALVPGPDTFMALRSTVAGGRARGYWTLFGITVACAIQGCLAALGLGAVILAAQPVFLTIKWAGVVYLFYLGVMSLWSASRKHSTAWSTGEVGDWNRKIAFAQGFLCNITNPKVLIFNVAVLPQFTGDDANIPTLLLFGMTLVFIGSLWLAPLIWVASKAVHLITRDTVRRWIDGVTGVVFIGFASALSLESGK